MALFLIIFGFFLLLAYFGIRVDTIQFYIEIFPMLETSLTSLATLFFVLANFKYENAIEAAMCYLWGVVANFLGWLIIKIVQFITNIFSISNNIVINIIVIYLSAFADTLLVIISLYILTGTFYALSIHKRKETISNEWWGSW